MRLKVGCCGYPSSMKEYFETFSLVELQSTFYNLPKLSTANLWRQRAPKTFEFSMKTWQVITHLTSSPSWRRTRLKVGDNEKANYGFLKSSEENLTAWNKTMEICRALGCMICVVQTPPSFNFSPENAKSIRTFFQSVKRETAIAWEPRGDWLDHEKEVERLCRELDLIHVVDLLRRKPSFVGGTAYFRLHGLNPREHDYKYHYMDQDLSRLLDQLRSLRQDVSEVYVLFNNVAMGEDAQRLIKMADKEGVTVA